MNTNLFYFNTLNCIGGIETFFYHLGKKYGSTHDITILYRNGDPEQVKRLSQFVRMKKYKDGQTVRCKRAFVAFNTDIIDKIIADEYIQMLHGDYRSLGVLPNHSDKVTKYVACSNVVKEAYEDITGEVPEVCYNPFTIEKPRKFLRLVSATRLTPDKGWNRMQQFAKVLDDAKIPYLWDVFSDQIKATGNPNIILHQPRLDVLNIIAASDYFVQLSDSEGYCYSIVESLSVGTPVIVTDMKVLPEIGVQNGKNGWILPMDMSSIPVEDIYKGIKKFKYTPLEDRWGELLLPVAPDYEEQMNQIVRVRCKKNFIDLERNVTAEFGEEWECTLGRAEFLEDLGVITIIEG